MTLNLMVRETADNSTKRISLEVPTRKAKGETMSAVTVVAQVVAREEYLEPLKAELMGMLAPTRQEEGCIEYRLHQDQDNPNLFLFFETWQDMECLQKHMNSPHFTRYAATVADWIADKTVYKMTSIG